jgi:membrane associated rhomboid family serine protease
MKRGEVSTRKERANGARAGAQARRYTRSSMAERPCFFHPDRLTGVSCSRCERPICPEDMIEAPVGIQCPICAGRMREGAVGEAAYRVRTRAERVPAVRAAARLSITNVLIAANVALFLLKYLNGHGESSLALVDYGAMYPGMPQSEWWRLFSAMFVHVTLFHLLFNMYALYLFGPPMEMRYGKVRFLLLYLISGFFGSAFSFAFGPAAVSAGASGAVFGIFGAHISFFFSHRHLAAARAQLRSMMVLLAVNFAFGLVNPGIDWRAHLGGLVAGMGIGFALEASGAYRDARRFIAPVVFGIVFIAAWAIALPQFGVVPPGF